MGEIPRYLLSIVVAALICAIVKNIVGNKGIISGVIRFLCGLFLVYCVISPWYQFTNVDFSSLIDSLNVDASAVIADGENMAYEKAADIIKTKTQAYILDKARVMDMDISVEVTLNDSNPPQPCAVKLTGETSPYGKKILSQYIEDNLGIAKEDQIWE